MSDEQLRILKMIEDKKITAEDGAKLLGALAATSVRERDAGQPPFAQRPAPPPSPSFDPFEFAFGRADRASRWEGRDMGAGMGSAREARRRRRDTEPFEAEARREGPVRFFRIKVTDSSMGTTLVNVNLPVSLVNFGLKLAARYLPEDSDLDLTEIQEAIRQGAIGKIIDIQQGEGDEPSKRVEISVE